MISDDERREVARKLRRVADKYGDGVASTIVERHLGLEDADGFWSGSVFTADSVRRLADLIEPGEPVPGETCELVGDGMPECEPLPPIVDRDALLEMADEMDELCGPWHDCGKHYARRIREALGEVTISD